MMQLGNHLQNLEADKQKLRTQVKRLCQENAWLRDELASTQKKLHECEQTNAAYSVEIEMVDGLNTSNGQTLDFHQQMEGKARTHRKSKPQEKNNKKKQLNVVYAEWIVID